MFASQNILKVRPAVKRAAGVKNVWLLGEPMANQSFIATGLTARGYQVNFIKTEEVIGGCDLPKPIAIIVEFNWMTDIGIRAYLLKNQKMQRLPVIYSGEKLPKYPAAPISILGCFTTETEYIESLDRLDEFLNT